MTDITVNLSYRNPETDALESNPISSPGFSPLRLVDFNGLSNNQSVVDTVNDPGSVAGKRFDSVLGNKGFFGGYGNRATTAVAPPGETSCCMMTIAEGSDGDPSGGDTGTPYGAFGGKLNFAIGETVPQGGEMWYAVKILIPAAFNWQAGGGGALKTMRVSQSNGSARLDYHALSGDWDASAASDVQIGWSLGNEIDATTSPYNQAGATVKTDLIVPRDEWVWLECYQLAHSNPALSKRRFWLNGEFVYELVGAEKKWRNQGGTISTETMSNGRETLPTSADSFVDVMWCTYWNGYSPIDNTMYLSKIAYTNQDQPPTDVDEYGNPRMGTNIV
jgi:hypothetical protein